MELFIAPSYDRSLIYIDMPFMDVQSTTLAVDEVNRYADEEMDGAVTSSTSIGVASITIEVNNLIVNSQWQSLGFALLFTVVTLAISFQRCQICITYHPASWLYGDDAMACYGWLRCYLSLITVMIGSILVGVGVDFSIHIANRIKEQGGTIEAIQTACAVVLASVYSKPLRLLRVA